MTASLAQLAIELGWILNCGLMLAVKVRPRCDRTTSRRNIRRPTHDVGRRSAAALGEAHWGFGRANAECEHYGILGSSARHDRLDRVRRDLLFNHRR